MRNFFSLCKIKNFTLFEKMLKTCSYKKINYLSANMKSKDTIRNKRYGGGGGNRTRVRRRFSVDLLHA